MADGSIIFQNAQEATIHHAANAAAVVIPVGAAVFHLPEYVTMITAGLGAIWYLILIGEWLYKKYRSFRYGVKGRAPSSD